MHVRRGRRGGVEVKGSMEEFQGNADYGGIVQPSQQHVAPDVKEVE